MDKENYEIVLQALTEKIMRLNIDLLQARAYIEEQSKEICRLKDRLNTQKGV